MDFDLTVLIELEPSAIVYRMRIRNLSKNPLWTAPGLHPYFMIPASGRNRMETTVAGFDLSTYRLDESLILPIQRVDLEIADAGRVSMIPMGGFLRPQGKLVIWSDREDYICFEPWAAGVGSIFRPGERVEVSAGEEYDFGMRLEVG